MIRVSYRLLRFARGRTKRFVTAGLAFTLVMCGTGCGSGRKSALTERRVVRSAGSSCTVPAVTGEAIGPAIDLVRKAHCKLGRITAFGNPPALYIVTKQSPLVGVVLPVDSAVDLQVSPPPAGLLAYRVPSHAMEPSLGLGDLVWVQTEAMHRR